MKKSYLETLMEGLVAKGEVTIIRDEDGHPVYRDGQVVFVLTKKGRERAETDPLIKEFRGTKEHEEMMKNVKKRQKAEKADIAKIPPPNPN